MGAIQDSLNQVANTALGAAAALTVKGELEKQNKLQKEEAAFNTAMKEAEMPVKKAEAKVEANEAQRQIDLFENKKEFTNEASAEIEKRVNDIVEKKGEITPKERQKIVKEVTKKWKPVAEGFQEEINFRYDEQKGKLSQKVYKAQVKAKKVQAKLIKERLEQLRGGTK